MSKSLFTFWTLSLLITAEVVGQPNQTDKDIEHLQGNWQATVMEVKGTRSDGDAAKKMTLIVKKDEFRLQSNGKDHVSAKLTLATGKKPKEIDLTLETGPVYKGIYEVDGDTMKLCFSLSSDADSPRPKDFTTNEESNFAYFSWQRTSNNPAVKDH